MPDLQTLEARFDQKVREELPEKERELGWNCTRTRH
jgi:hypothetical protein